jgi:glyoxylase-like metal-dependent hydrolase (beta-lactamase superfamily II)
VKIFQLKKNPNEYTSNAFLVLGSWNRLIDENILIDTGSDAYILNDIKTINTGVGKTPVDKIILTHCHFDHIGGITQIKKLYHSEVLANNKFDGVDRTISDGDILKLGDCYFEVIFTPGHSSDSICLYCKTEGVLFSGDTTLRINTIDESYTEDYIETIEKLSRLKINIIYPGHGLPITEKPGEMIIKTLRNIKNSKHFTPHDG